MSDMNFDDMRVELDQLAAQLDVLSSALDASKKEREALREQRKALQEQRKRLRTQRKVAKIAGEAEEVERFQEEIDALNAQIEPISDQMDAMDDSIDKAREQYSAYLNQLGDMRNRLFDLQKTPDDDGEEEEDDAEECAAEEDDEDDDEDDGEETDEATEAGDGGSPEQTADAEKPAAGDAAWSAAINELGARLDEVLRRAASRMNTETLPAVGAQVDKLSKTAVWKAKEAGKQAKRAAEQIKTNFSFGFNHDNDYQFAGVGSMGSGDWRDMHVSGAGKATGDICCRNLRVSGSFRAEKALECRKEIRISGSFKANGPVKAQSIRCYGAYKSGSDVEAEVILCAGAGSVVGSVRGENLRLTVPGTLTVQQDISAREIHLSGILHVDGSCETEYYESTGRQTICGLLNADTVKLCLVGESTIAEIGCTNLSISPPEGDDSANRITLGDNLVFDLNGGSVGRLKVGSIEGDNLSLANTEAETVRGTNVTVGPNCKIGTLEYYGTCMVSPEASVGTCTKR